MEKKKIYFESPDFKNIRDAINYSSNLYKENIAFVLKTIDENIICNYSNFNTTNLKVVNEKENVLDKLNDIKNSKNNLNIKSKKNKYMDNTKYLSITFNEFLRDVYTLAHYFISNGYSNKRVGIISKNRYEWIVTYTACFFANIVSVPMDKGYTSLELLSSINRAKVDLLVLDKDIVPVVNEIILNNSNKNIIEDKDKEEKQKQKQNNNIIEKLEYILMDNSLETITKKEIKSVKSEFKYLNFWEILTKTLIENKYSINNIKKEIDNIKINENDLAVLLFTSGTTSNSKIVSLSQKNITTNIVGVKLLEDIKPIDNTLAFLPYHHTFGSTGQLVMLYQGVRTAYCDGIRYIAKNLVEYNCTMFIGVPALIEGIYNNLQKEIRKQKKEKLINKMIKISNTLLKFNIDIRRILFKPILTKLGGLRLLISGASSLNPIVHQGLIDLGIDTLQGYGLTETAPILAAENYKEKRVRKYWKRILYSRY